MATLEKRVQVLFDEGLYARLLAEAQVERMSVGAFIRDAVEERLSHRRKVALESLKELFASADEHPSGPIDWAVEKELLDRDFLRDIP